MFVMIDVGGQCAFLEMIPLLMSGPAIYLTFFNLTKHLDDKYFDGYNKGGNDVLKNSNFITRLEMH